jgi:hypothetical protein
MIGHCVRLKLAIDVKWAPMEGDTRDRDELCQEDGNGLVLMGCPGDYLKPRILL